MVFTSATTSVPEASAPPAPYAMSKAPDALPDSRRRGDRASAASGGSARAASSACSFVAPGARTSSPVADTRPPVPSTAASENGTAASGAPRGPACARSHVTSNDGAPLSASRWWRVPSTMSALARVTVQAGSSAEDASPAARPGMVSSEPVRRTHTSGPRRRSAPSATDRRPRSRSKRDSSAPRSQRPGTPWARRARSRPLALPVILRSARARSPASSYLARTSTRPRRSATGVSAARRSTRPRSRPAAASRRRTRRASPWLRTRPAKARLPRSSRPRVQSATRVPSGPTPPVSSSWRRRSDERTPARGSSRTRARGAAPQSSRRLGTAKGTPAASGGPAGSGSCHPAAVARSRRRAPSSTRARTR